MRDRRGGRGGPVGPRGTGSPPSGDRTASRGSGPPPQSGPGERMVYGAGPVRELLAVRPASIKAIWVDPQRAGRQTSDQVAAIVVAARANNVTLEDRDRAHLDRAAGEGALHQGVIAWLGEFRYAHLEDIIAPSPSLVVALDNVEDPRNLGAILRSAYLLGAGGVIIPDHRAAQVTSTVAKASAGASELLPVVQVGNLVRALDELRELGLWRVAVHASEQAQRIDQIDGKLPLCLVLGAEGTGIRPLVAKNCDFHAVIDMAAGREAVGSFNVSVAASLALYEMRRQRAAAT